MTFSPNFVTLASGVRALATTETFDVKMIDGKGLIVTSDVTAGVQEAVPGTAHLEFTSSGFEDTAGQTFHTSDTHDMLASLGITDGAAIPFNQVFDGSALTLPLHVVAGVNDTFIWSGAHFVVAAGTHSTGAALAVAVQASVLTEAPSLTLAFFMNVASIGSADVPAISQTVSILGVDEASGKTWPILVGAVQDSVGMQVLEVGPSSRASANKVAVSQLPTRVRISVSHATADPITRTLGYQRVVST